MESTHRPPPPPPVIHPTPVRDFYDIPKSDRPATFGQVFVAVYLAIMAALVTCWIGLAILVDSSGY